MNYSMLCVIFSFHMISAVIWSAECTYSSDELTQFFGKCQYVIDQTGEERSFEKVVQTIDLLLTGENRQHLESFMQSKNDNTLFTNYFLGDQNCCVSVLCAMNVMSIFKDDTICQGGYKNIWKAAFLNMVPVYTYVEKMYKESVLNQELRRSFQESLEKAIEIVKEFKVPDYSRLFHLMEIQENTCSEHVINFSKWIDPKELENNTADPVVKMHMIFYIMRNILVSKEEFPEHYSDYYASDYCLSDICKKYTIDLTKCLSRMGNGLLHLAVMKECVEMVRYLLTVPNLNSKLLNNEQKTPFNLALAMSCNYVEKAKVLRHELDALYKIYNPNPLPSVVAASYISSMSEPICAEIEERRQNERKALGEDRISQLKKERDAVKEKIQLLKKRKEKIEQIIQLIKQKNDTLLWS